MKKIGRILFISFSISTLVLSYVYVTDPQGFKGLNTNQQSLDSHYADTLAAHGMDTRLATVVNFTWDKVCLTKKFTGKEESYKRALELIPYAKNIIFPSSMSKGETLFFYSSSDKTVRILPTCFDIARRRTKRFKKCIPFSDIQKYDKCFSNNAVLRVVYHMKSKQSTNAYAKKMILTDQPNIVNVPTSHLQLRRGPTQNFLTIYDNEK